MPFQPCGCCVECNGDVVVWWECCTIHQPHITPATPHVTTLQRRPVGHPNTVAHTAGQVQRPTLSVDDTPPLLDETKRRAALRFFLPGTPPGAVMTHDAQVHALLQHEVFMRFVSTMSLNDARTYARATGARARRGETP